MRGPRGDPDGAEFSLADDELLNTFPPDNDLSCVAEDTEKRSTSGRTST
jgi:hypothetical protein